MARLKSTNSRPGPKKGRRATTPQTPYSGKANKSVRTLSSEAEKNVGRPGFKSLRSAVVQGKASVNRVMQRDPAVGIESAAANKITSTNVDLVGPVSPTILGQLHTAPPNAGSRIVRPAVASQPVYSNKPGKVVRVRRRQVGR